MSNRLAGNPVKVAVLLEHLANELGAIYTTYRLLEEQFRVEVLTPDGGPKLAGHSGMALDRFIQVKGKIAEADPADYAAVVCPGGFSADKLRALPEVQRLLQHLDRDRRLIAHIGHGAWITLSAGVLKGRKVVSPGQIKSDLENGGAICIDAAVVEDGHILSGSEYGPFFRTLVQRLHERIKVAA
jgi:protease I